MILFVIKKDWHISVSPFKVIFLYDILEHFSSCRYISGTEQGRACHKYISAGFTYGLSIFSSNSSINFYEESISPLLPHFPQASYLIERTVYELLSTKPRIYRHYQDQTCIFCYFAERFHRCSRIYGNPRLYARRPYVLDCPVQVPAGLLMNSYIFCLYPVSLFDTLGDFMESLFVWGVDCEFCWRAKRCV